jgi:hypothetical protein
LAPLDRPALANLPGEPDVDDQLTIRDGGGLSLPVPQHALRDVVPPEVAGAQVAARHLDGGVPRLPHHVVQLSLGLGSRGRRAGAQ